VNTRNANHGSERQRRSANDSNAAVRFIPPRHSRSLMFVGVHWRSLRNQGAFTKNPELRTELRRGKNQLKKLVLPRPLRKYGFCSLGILEVFIARLVSNSFRSSVFIA
jgi:hypothetical protein